MGSGLYNIILIGNPPTAHSQRGRQRAAAARARVVHALGAGGALRGPVQPPAQLPAARPLPAHRQGLQQLHRRR